MVRRRAQWSGSRSLESHLTLSSPACPGDGSVRAQSQHNRGGRDKPGHVPGEMPLQPPGPPGACHRAGQRPDPLGRPDDKLRVLCHKDGG
jgi:hypothetical protein